MPKDRSKHYYPDRTFPLRSVKPDVPIKRGRRRHAKNEDKFAALSKLADGTLTAAEIADRLGLSPIEIDRAVKTLRYRGFVLNFKPVAPWQGDETRERNAQMAGLYVDGVSQAEIARRFGLTRNRVYEIIRAYRLKK